eukprot:gene22288-30531_t
MGNNSSISNDDSLDNTAPLDKLVRKPTLKFSPKLNLTDMRMTVSNFVPADGVGYVGNLDKSGQKHGIGRFIYENGDEYEGEWANDKKHGKGIYRMVNGDVFEGEFKDGQRCGRGTYKYASGALYSGDFRNNKMHGHGTYVYNSGAKYIGAFAVDKMHGEGALYFLDGTSYRGFWINGIADKTNQSDDNHQDKSLYFSNHNNDENTPSSENVLHRSRSLFTPERKNASLAHVHDDNYNNDLVIEVHKTSQSDRKAVKVRSGNAYNNSNNNRVQVISLSKGDDGSDEEKEIFEKTLSRSPYNYPKQSTSPLKVEDYDDSNSSSQTFSLSDVYSKTKSQKSVEYFELDRSRICDLV